MKREIMDAINSESSLSLIMLDIDNFKQYNDANGHQAGDDALRFIANILTAKLRQQDMIYGGEEFLVLPPKTSAEGMALVAEKIRRDGGLSFSPQRKPARRQDNHQHRRGLLS